MRRSRLLATLVDQAAFSLQNFAIVFAGLHWLELRELGLFNLIVSFMILAQATLRSFTIEPLSIRFSRCSTARRRDALMEASGLALFVGTGGVGLSLVAWAFGMVSSLMVVAALVWLVLIVQDVWRGGLLAARRPWACAGNDVLCLTATLLGLASLAGSEQADPADLLTAWGAGGIAGAILGALQFKCLPDPLGAGRWLRSHLDLGWPIAGSTLAQQASGRASLVVISLVSGPSALGQVSAARALLTPMNSVITATTAFSVPEAVARLHDSQQSLIKFTNWISIGLAAIAGTLTLLLWLVPDALGLLIAGPNWMVAQQVLLPTGLWIVGIAWSQGARIGLRALQQPSLVFKTGIWLGMLVIVATAMGALGGGGYGAAWGFGVASLLGQLGWSHAYRAGRQRQNPIDGR